MRAPPLTLYIGSDFPIHSPCLVILFGYVSERVALMEEVYHSGLWCFKKTNTLSACSLLFAHGCCFRSHACLPAVMDSCLWHHKPKEVVWSWCFITAVNVVCRDQAQVIRLTPCWTPEPSHFPSSETGGSLEDNLDCPRSGSINQAGVELRDPPIYLRSTGIKDVYHNSWLSLVFFFKGVCITVKEAIRTFSLSRRVTTKAYN